MKVIDMSTGTAGQFAALLLAELGWDVTRLEFATEPRPDPLPAPAHLAFDFLNRRKRSVEVDIETAEGQSQLRSILASTHGVIEDRGPGGLERLGLSWREIHELDSHVVLLSISSFGLEGPRSNWLANDFIQQAMGGVVWGTGWQGHTPLKLPDGQSEMIAGLNGAVALMAAVRGVMRSAHTGCQLDLSIQACMALQWTRQVTRWLYSGRPYGREKKGAGRQGFPHTTRASDGWLYMLAMGVGWEEVAVFLGLVDYATSEWDDPAVREARWGEIDPAFQAAVQARSKYDWFNDAASNGYYFAPIDEPGEVVESPQLAAREFFCDAELQNGQVISCPGLPFRVPQPNRANRVPKRGEDTAEVFQASVKD